MGDDRHWGFYAFILLEDFNVFSRTVMLCYGIFLELDCGQLKVESTVEVFYSFFDEVIKALGLIDLL